MISVYFSRIANLKKIGSTGSKLKNFWRDFSTKSVFYSTAADIFHYNLVDNF